MPSASPVHAALETKVAGITIDALGRKWDPSKHPRDSRGRFIETGGIARVGLGGLGKVVRSMIGGKVEVEMQGSGEHKIVPHQQLTMVRRPDGSKPTASVRKVAEQDAIREDHPDRGDGKFERDTNPELPIPDKDPADEDDDNPFDGEPDNAGVPDAYTPSREEPREGDIIAITARGKNDQLHHMFAKVDSVKNGVPDKITLSDKRRSKTDLATVRAASEKNGARTEDVTVLPFEDLKDPAAFMADAEDDNGRFAVLDNETATDLVEGHAKVTAPKPTRAAGQGDRKPGGGKNDRTLPGPVNKDDLVMGRKPNTIELNGRIVGRIEKDPEHPGRWKVTDPWRRTKVVGQKWDTGRTALANMLNNPPKQKGEQEKPAAAAPAETEQLGGLPGWTLTSDGKLTSTLPDGRHGIISRNEDGSFRWAVKDDPREPVLADDSGNEKFSTPQQAAEALSRKLDATPAEPEAPAKVEAATNKKAAGQSKSTTRKKSASGDRTYYVSKSGNIAAVRIGSGQWAVYHRIEKPEHRSRFKHDQIGDDWYEVVHRDDSPSQPVVLPSLDVFRDEWLGNPDRDRADLPTLADRAAQAEADQDEQNTYSQFKSDFATRVAKATTLEELDVLEHEAMQQTIDKRREELTHNVSARRNFMANSQDSGTDQESSRDDLAATINHGDDITLEEMSDADLQRALDLGDALGPGRRAAVRSEQERRSASKPRLPEGAAPQKPKTTSYEQRSSDYSPGDQVETEFGRGGVIESTDRSVLIALDSEPSNPIRVQRGTPGFDRIKKIEAADKPARLPDGAAPQKPKAERAPERPNTDPTLDYPESSTTEGAPDGAVRADGTDVLGDVPPVAGSDDGRPGSVLREPVGSGGGADRADAPDAAVRPEGRDERAGDRGASGAAAGGDRERAAGPRVPAAGAGDRGQEAAGDGAGGLGDAARGGDAQPVAATPAAAPAKKPTRTTAGPSVEKNLDALRTLRTIEAEGRPATAEERKVLAGWAGWGALPKVFAEDDPTYATERAELKELLGEDGWRKARTNMLNAHYTDPKLVSAVWEGLQALGFDGGEVLEPGAGSGNFIAQAPKGAHMTGVEVEPVTAGIAQALHPDSDIHLESFAKSPFRAGVFDAVIGNVPFGQYALQDRKHNADNHSIHNHFIIKSLDTLKPGGVMAVVSSSFTLDSQDARAREAMYAQADLIGAVRLPEGAHEKAAGTSVVTDVLLFRKRAGGEAPGDDSWLHVSPATDKDGQPVVGIKRGDKDPSQQYINDYFTQHPDDLLGEVKSGGYNGLKVVGEKDPAPKLRERLTALAAAAKKAGRGHTAERHVGDQRPALRDAGSTREGRISFRGSEKNAKGKDAAVFERIEDGRRERFEVPATQAEEFKALLDLRDLYEALMAAELEADTDDDDTMTAARAALRNAYRRYVAKYGPVTRYTVTEKDGATKTTYPPVMGKFRQDEGAAVVFGLESDFDPDTNDAKPADVLTSRQLRVTREIAQHTDDPNDAIALAAERPGGLSNKTLAEVLQTTPAKARAMVKGLVFNDPEHNGQMVSKAAYLSGNVRKKLAAAEAATADNEAYNENVEALREVLPPAATLADMPLQLGSAFIGADIVTEFAQHMMRNRSAEVINDEGQWRVPTPKGYGRNHQLESDTWGTPDRSFYSLLESILKGQHRIIRITRRNEDGSTWVDKKASEEAALKAQEIEQEFQDWVWARPDIGDALAAAYTAKHRSLVPRSYDDAPQRSYPGMAEWLELRPHQNAAVTRGLNEPAVLFEHVVGAGKTYELAALAMELRRLGMSRKPVLTVPNHMLAQWTKEFREAYPNAKILAADSDALSGKDNRKRFAAMAANNDWDVVLMTHTAFESIPTSREWEEKYLHAELDRYQRQLRNARQGNDKRREKQIQTQLQKLEKKIADRLARRKDDDGITFETIGFDYVMADEAHVYKNLDFQTGMQGIASPEGSGRARDMHMKLELLRSQKPTDGTERVAAFATGTPISNSLAEMYTMTRFMRPDLLDEAGVGDFDAWASTFALVAAKVEQDTSASGWKEVVRMRGFTDALGDALRIWRTFSDTKTAKDLNLPRPKLKGGERKIHVVAPSDAQIDALGSFKDRVETLPSRPTKGDDTHVAIIGDGRRAAIDPRLMSERGLARAGIDPDDESIDSPKIDAMAANIATIYHQRKGDVFKVAHDSDEDAELTGALQMVMIDSDAPKKGKRSSYQMLKDRLVAQGVPADQIRFVQEAAGSSEKKAKLFEDARQGRVAVLMGSTAALGTGTNVQNRLYAMHHGDGSWKPSDIEQREGRILRQGNQYPEVEVHAYVTERTHDVKTWDMTAYKQAALDAIAHGSYDMRGLEFADDVDPLTDYDTITGLASGDPLVQDRRDLAPELKRLRNAERSHRRQIDRARGVVAQADRQIDTLDRRKRILQDALARRQDISGDQFKMTLTPHGTFRPKGYDTRKDAAAAMKDLVLAKLEEGYWAPGRQPAGIVGSIGGFDIRMSTINESGAKRQVVFELTTAGPYGEPLPLSPVTMGEAEATTNAEGALTRLENRVSGIESAMDKIDGEVARIRSEREAAEEATHRRFRFTQDLADAERREQLLDKLLTGNVDNNAGESPELLREEYAEVTARSKGAEAAAKAERMRAMKAAANTEPDPEPLKVTPDEQAVADEQLAAEVAKTQTPKRTVPDPRERRTTDRPSEGGTSGGASGGDGGSKPPTPPAPPAGDADQPEEKPQVTPETGSQAPVAEPLPEDAQAEADVQQAADVEERAQAAADEAYDEAIAAGEDDDTATEEAQAAMDAVHADAATEDADAAGERPVVPDPSNDEAAAEDAGEASTQAEQPQEAQGETLTPRQLDGEKYPLNPQQQTIADKVVGERKNVLVRAKAGTGKTSTLEAIARRFEQMSPEDKVLYICFNKTVQVEAEGRMPGNVESRTGHSLAYQWVGRDFTDRKMGGPGKKPTNPVLRKDTEVAAYLGITSDMPTKEQGTVLTPRRQAALALKAVAKFANSADDELGYEHFTDDGADLLANLPDRERVRMLGYAKKAWADIKSPDGEIRTSFDHIRKMWALSKPDLTKTGAGNKRAASVLFLDEAQDTPPVLAKVVADQDMQKVIVGDGDQQIYSFTGAKNYLDDVQVDAGDDLPLDTSYRFGRNIADIANRFLQVLGSKERVVGGGSEDGTVREGVKVGTMGDAQAILTRSNAGMIGEILGEQMSGRTVGVAPGTKKDLQLFIDTARYLKGEGNAPSVMHEDLAAFENWAQVEEAIAEDGDPKLTMLQKLIDQYGLDGLEDILDRVVEVDKDGLAGDSETVASTGLLSKVTANRDSAKLTLGGGTYPLNEALKEDTGKGLGQFGFRWDGGAKAWAMVGSPDEQNDALDALRAQFGVSAGQSAKPDVMVITAHKSKGLEWDRVKIGDDFPQPKEEEHGIVYPDAENLRLAYVAVTRAGKELDPGSLEWVFAHSDENGGKPGQEPTEHTEETTPETAPVAEPAEETMTVSPADLPSLDDEDEEGDEDGWDDEEETPARPSDADFTVEQLHRDADAGEATRFFDGWIASVVNPETGDRFRGHITSIRRGTDANILHVYNRDTREKIKVAVPHGTPINAYPDTSAAHFNPDHLAANPDSSLERLRSEAQAVIDGNLLDPAGDDTKAQEARGWLAAVEHEIAERRKPRFTGENPDAATRDEGGYLMQDSNEVPHATGSIASRKIWLDQLAAMSEGGTRFDVETVSGAKFDNVMGRRWKAPNGDSWYRLLDANGDPIEDDAATETIVRAHVVAGTAHVPGGSFMRPEEIEPGTRVRYSRDGKDRDGILEYRDGDWWVIGDPAERTNKRQGVVKGQRPETRIETNRDGGAPLAPMWRIDGRPEHDDVTTDAPAEDQTVTVAPVNLDADEIDLPTPSGAPEQTDVPDADRPEERDVPETDQGDRDEADADEVDADPDGDGITDEERERRRRRRRDSRRRYDPNPNGNNNDSGGMGGLGGAPLGAGVPLEDLPLYGYPNEGGSGGSGAGDESGDRSPVSIGDGRDWRDLSVAELEDLQRQYRDALIRGYDDDNARLAAQHNHDALDGWIAEKRAESFPRDTAGSLQVGDTVVLDGREFRIEDIDAAVGSDRGRRFRLWPTGNGFPIGRVETWPDDRRIDRGDTDATPEAPSTPAPDVAQNLPAVGGFDPANPESDASRAWVRENWNDGNPHRKPALGQIVLSPGLSVELRMIDWDSREADGIDPGYTWGPQDRFVVVHDKAQALSAFDNLADILGDQANDDRSRASIAKAAAVRAEKVRELPDATPATTADTTAVGERVSADQLLVGDAIEGVLGSTGERGNLRVETANTDSAMDLITGVNDAGERDVVRVPTGESVTRLGSRADDGSRETAWNRDAAQAPAAPGETGMLSTEDLEPGDVIHGKAGGITGRWQLVRKSPYGTNPLFDKWEVVPEGRPDATPEHINLSKKRPVKVVKRAEFTPPATDENGFEPGELADGDTPATQADIDHLLGRDTAATAATAEGDTDVRPETLVNGNLPNPNGLMLPADTDGSYSPEQIEYLSQYGGGQVVANVGDDWHLGTFEGVRDGGYVFRPATSQAEDDVLTIDPDQLDEVRAVSGVESLSEPVAPESLRPGTRVAFTRDRKMRVGVLEGVTEGGRAQVRDINGTVHETTIGGKVRAVIGSYAPGNEPTEPPFAPRPGVWTPAGQGWATGAEGEWVAGIQPDGLGYRWQVEGAPMSGVTVTSGTAPTVEAAQEAVTDALYQQAGNGARVTTLPGRDEEHRDAASRELRDTLAALRGEGETTATPEAASPETAEAPAIDGAQAGWVPTGELQPGDVARVDGDNGNGSAVTRTGHVLGTPETNEVHTPTGGKPAKATRTPIGPDRSGLGDRETLLSPEESVAARVERDEEDGDADNPANAFESQVLADRVGTTLPTDRDGAGVYPGSVVEDHRGRQGVVSEVWDLDAAVRWTGKDGDERVRPGTLRVVQQNRPDGWTAGGRKVEADQLVTIDGDQGRVVSVSGDDVEVEVGGVHRTVSAGDLRVVGAIGDNPADPDDGPVLEPAFDAPPSVEGLDVRPTAPVKPEPLGDGAEQVRPNLNDDDRALIGELGLDIDATSPYGVQQAAARIRHGMPLSNEQAADLSAWLGALLGSNGVPAGRARRVKRLRNRLDAALQRAGGPAEPRPAVGAPEVTTAGELVRGDMVALPNPATGEAVAGTVRGIWPDQNGQIALVTVEHADGTWSTHRLNPDGEVYRLPDLDSIDTPTEPEAPANEVAEDAPFTQPRVSERLQDAGQAIVDAAVGDDDRDPESLEQLAADVADGLDSGRVEREQRNASGRLETSLEGAGVSEDSAAAAHGVAEDTADDVAEQVADTVRRTVADTEPLPGESDADAAKRVRDRLRQAADEVSYDEAAQAAIDRAVADADGDLTVPPTAAEQAHATREITDALRNDLFALADQLAALGNVEDAQALSDVAARLAGRPDEEHVQRAIAAASMGRGPGKVRTLARRIRGMFARARARFIDRVQAIRATATKANRSWKAAVAAARAEWNGNTEVAGLVADAAKHLATGGDRDGGGGASVEPQEFADRVGFWGEQLPDDSGMFGRTERTRRGFRGLTLDRLRSGAQVEDTTLTGSVLDRAADGGPGETALGHHAAVTGIGTAVRDEVNARIRGMLPEFGDDPASHVREALDHADRVEREERDDLTDDELAVLRRKAREGARQTATLYANARAEALAGVLASVRPMGPQGAAELRVQGRADDAPEVEAMRWAERVLPTDWLASAGTIEVKAGRMGSYDGDGEITVAPLTDAPVEGAGRYGVSALHGLAHHLETVLPGLAEAGWVHHWVKTSSGTPGARARRGRNGLAWFADLFPGVGFTKDDGAARLAAFVGTESQDGDHFEWVPTALAMILAGDVGADLDDDLEQFMLGLLAWLGRPRRDR